MDEILGSFEARQTNTWTLDVQYRVFSSSGRLVAVRTGGQFAGQGAQMAAVQFGVLGVLFHALFLEKRAARRKAEQAQALERCTLSELLARHPKNFEVPLHSVERARIDRQRFSMHGQAVARLVLEVRQRDAVTLLLQTEEQLHACRTLLAQVLGGRLTVDPALPAPAPPSMRRARTG